MQEHCYNVMQQNNMQHDKHGFKIVLKTNKISSHNTTAI